MGIVATKDIERRRIHSARAPAINKSLWFDGVAVALGESYSGVRYWHRRLGLQAKVREATQCRECETPFGSGDSRHCNHATCVSCVRQQGLIGRRKQLR